MMTCPIVHYLTLLLWYFFVLPIDQTQNKHWIVPIYFHGYGHNGLPIVVFSIVSFTPGQHLPPIQLNINLQ